MPNEPTLHAAMEGAGSYDKHAKLPAGSAALALPLWERATQRVELDADHQAVVLADYGSSQGKNSLVPMQRAIRSPRRRLGPAYPISVFHIDQPSNGFNTLFKVLDSDPDRYAFDDPSLFPAVVGSSFYEQALPPDSVHLGWCSDAAL